MDSFSDYEPISNNTATEDSFSDYTPVDTSTVVKPKSLLERTRRLLSPITGPTAEQQAENPITPFTPTQLDESPTRKFIERSVTLPLTGIPYTSQDALNYFNRVRNAQGLIPKALTSPVDLPSAPQASSTMGQISSGLYNIAAKGIIEPLLSPGGVATLGIGAAAKGGSALANLALRILSGTMLPSAAGQISEGINAPTLQQKIEQIGGGGLLAGGSILGMRGIKPGVKPSVVPEEQVGNIQPTKVATEEQVGNIQPTKVATDIPPPSPDIPQAKITPTQTLANALPRIPSSPDIPTTELNEPIPTPWLSTDPPIKPSIVKAEIKRVGDNWKAETGNDFPLAKAPLEVQKQWLQDQTGAVSDTPDFAKQEGGPDYSTPSNIIKPTTINPGQLEFIPPERQLKDNSQKLLTEPEDKFIDYEPVKQLTDTPINNNNKIAPIKFIGQQEGVGTIPTRDLYNLTEDVEGLGKKGSTITGDKIVEKGYTLPSKEETIISSAIRDPSTDRIYTGTFHSNAIKEMEKQTNKSSPANVEHGFFTSKNRFVTSDEAYDIAARQLIKKEINKPLNESVENATKPESTIGGEYKGVPTGKDVPTNSEQIRQSEGTKTSDSSSLQRPIKEGLPEGESKPTTSGLNIKLNPNTGELGGIDLSAVMDFARETYSNLKDFAAWSKTMLSRFPELGEHIKNVWIRLKSGELDAPGLATDITKLRAKSPQHRIVADAAYNALDDISTNRGKYAEDITRNLKQLVGPKTITDVVKGNKPSATVSPKDYLSMNTDSAKRVTQYLYDMQDNGHSPITLNADENKAVDTVRSYNRMVRQETINRPGFEKEGFNNEYMQQPFSDKSLDTITNHSASPLADKYKSDFVNWRVNKVGQSKEEALNDWDSIKEGLSKTETKASEQFGPLDKAASKGIPPSMRSDNLFQIFHRYGNRVGRRFSYYDNIESKPEVMSALKENVSTDKYWKRLSKELSGQREQEQAGVNAAAGLVSSGLIGPVTEAKNYWNSQYIGIHQFTPKQILTTGIKSYLQFIDNFGKTFKLGLNKENIGSIQFGEGGLTDTIKVANRIRDISNATQLKNLSEQGQRTFNVGEGRVVTMENFEKARQGKLNSTEQRWMDTYGGRENWKQYLKEGILPEEVLNRMAKRYVESVQGTYDSRTLPYIATKGPLAGFLALSRWDIGRTNQFMRQVVTPLANGDISPALKSVLQTAIGAPGMAAILYAATKRRSSVPSINEISAAQDQNANIEDPVLYKMVNMVNLSGIVGFYGGLLQKLEDVLHGNRTQAFNNSLVEGVTKLGEKTVDLISAYQNGDVHFRDVPNILNEFLVDHLQSYRLMLDQFSSKQQEGINRSNMFKEKRVFDQITGRPVKSLSSDDETNPFLGPAIREYKQTSDIDRAVELMPRIGEEVQAKSKNDPETMIRTLKGFKENSYNTFPDPKKAPIEFNQYFSYLQQTKGLLEAQRMLADYHRMRDINKVKSSFIP